MLSSSHLAAVLADAAPHLHSEFVGSVAGILNVAYGYACGAGSSPPAQDTNLTPLDGM